MVKIYDIDSPLQIASKVWEHLEIGQSVSVLGFCTMSNEILPKGEVVLSELRRLDELENVYTSGARKTRKVKFKKDSVGGPLAQKIFVWDKRIVDKEPRYTIWRFQ